MKKADEVFFGDPKSYLSSRPLYQPFQIELVKSQLSGAPQNYLDVGCGPGVVFFLFESLFPGYKVAIDINSKMINQLKAIVKEHPRLKSDPKVFMYDPVSF